MDKVKLAYGEFWTMYDAHKLPERIVVEAFAAVQTNDEVPFRAVVRVFRYGEKDISRSVITFWDDVSFVMAVSDALRVPNAKLEGAMLKAQTALIDVLYRIHKKKPVAGELKPHAGVYKYNEKREKRENSDGCAIM